MKKSSMVRLRDPNKEDMKHNVFEDNAVDNPKHIISKSNSNFDNSFADFLVKTSLYEQYSITEANIKEVAEVLNGDAKINLYCPICGEKRVFYMEPVYPTYSQKGFDPKPISFSIQAYLNARNMTAMPQPTFANAPAPTGKVIKFDWFHGMGNEEGHRVVNLPFHCSAEDSHITDFTILFSNESAIKIGQFPSFADLTKPEFRKYKGLLPDEYFNELRRAVGLNSSEIGIGSYVYLRRIIERLVNDAAEKAVKDGQFTQEEFERDNGRQRSVVDKVKMLKGYLPDFMIDNANIYSIVSKGIHELSDDDCKQYFDVLYRSILMILDDMLERKKKEDNQRELTNSIAKIVGDLK